MEVKHPPMQTMINFALEIPLGGEEQTNEVLAHLRECAECTAAVNQMREFKTRLRGKS